MNKRLSRLRSAMDEAGLGCMLVTRMENVRYLSGFSGSSAAALVTAVDSFLVTDGRYREQAAAEAIDWDISIYSGSMPKAITRAIPGGVRCGFEVTCSFDFYRKLCAEVDASRLEPMDGIIEELRVIKDAGEISLIRDAITRGAKAFDVVRPGVLPGASERELAALLDYRMSLAGADGPAFDTVVASGPNSALPHAPLTDRRLEETDMVVIDFGARKEGYRSDTTRTMLMPDAPERARQAYQVVRGALEAALKALKPGMQAAQLDTVARGHLAKAGLAERFTHALGHGIGLETHEKPTLSASSTDALEPGMVFTLEPGAYIEGFGGVRIEEMVLLTELGPEVLTSGIP